VTPPPPFLVEFERASTTSALLPERCACLVAVSGGLDSRVLLGALASVAPRHGWRLVVAHFNHRLRGADADADERFVADLAARHGLPFALGSADVAAGREPGESPESAARRFRHAFLARAAREHGCDRIALGHHEDDQVELFLLRLLRGAGGEGLSGMAEREVSPADSGVSLVRPLLGFSRARLEEVAVACGWEWRVDASNRDPAVPRNRIRHELVPLLRARYQPALERVLLREQTLLRDQALVIGELADTWLRGEAERGFGELSTAIQREVIRQQLIAQRLEPGFELIETLRTRPLHPIQVDPARRVICDASGRVAITGNGAVDQEFSPAEAALVFEGTSGSLVFAGVRFDWELRENDSALGAGLEEQGTGMGREIMDAASVGTAVRLRHWRAGDRFRPIGLKGSAKLQDLFTNQRVPAWERRRRVVMESAEGEILWVEGLRLGERVRVTPATCRRLVWRWCRSEHNGLAVGPDLPNLPVRFGNPCP
jgi:tRNA(Ile)-lysidine synthase